MSVDPAQAAAAQRADERPAPAPETADRSPSPAAEPAPRASESPSLGTLADAFRDPEARAALKATRGAGPDGTPSGAAEESAPSSITSDAEGASKPADQGADRSTPGLSRRGAAQAISERDAEIERLVAERERERQVAAEATSKAAAVHGQHEAARKAALDMLGDDREFARLQAARLRNQPLSMAEDDALDRMLATREYAGVFWELADRGHKVEMAKGLADRIARHGLDRDTAFGAALPELIDHAVAVTEQRVRKEQSERIAELEQQVKGLRPRATAAGRPSPTTGGASGGDGRMLEDGASPREWFTAGLRERGPRRVGARA